ncbi:RNA polymerase subunit sigma-70 [Kribbella sp. NBC_00709]|uniref:RNA polymerase subunit sigma-70 n=1 Tax=Kribbella sp. NBC_00709 TaxID=2975972 RepID=UPI002E2A166C|nr:RNA polymerase subunit sigma-70 [Kribbella sp. NBC_00709]
MTSSGDEAWFRDAFEQHRRALHAHCYRLAGNVPDADDLVQETFLRGWRSRTQFEGRASTRTWLYRIATNVYLDHRKAAARRSVPVGDPMEWCTDIGPYPDALLDPSSDLAARETVELALIAALMYLPPRQRAAFVLRDVSGWTPVEIADALDLAVPAVNSLIQRARKTLRHYAPTDSRQWRRPALTAEDEDILRRYAAATDPADFRELLAAEVRITMPPDPPVFGRDAAAAFLGRPMDWRTVPSAANGRPALICYLRHPGTDRYEALVVDVLTIENGKITKTNAFTGPHHIAAFGLPTTLDAAG